jgi:Metallopeptidase family M24
VVAGEAVGVQAIKVVAAELVIRLGNWLCFATNATETVFGQRWITGPVDRIIRVSDYGNSDSGPSYKRYQFDFQRAFYVGKPSQEVVDWYDVGRDTMLETIDAVRPGVRAGDLFETSLRAGTRRGAPEHPICFIAHSEGLANHEPPWLVAGNPAVIAPGMVLAIEVGAFHESTTYVGACPRSSSWSPTRASRISLLTCPPSSTS